MCGASLVPVDVLVFEFVYTFKSLSLTSLSLIFHLPGS